MKMRPIRRKLTVNKNYTLMEFKYFICWNFLYFFLDNHSLLLSLSQAFECLNLILFGHFP